MEAIEFINRQKNALIKIGILLFALIIASRIYKAQNTVIESLKVKVDDEVKKNEILIGIGQSEKKINLYRQLFLKHDTASAMNILSGLARDARVKIVSIRPSAQEKLVDYAKVPFELSITAPGYREVGRFISSVENNESIYMVDSMSVDTERQSGELRVNLRVSAIIFTK